MHRPREPDGPIVLALSRVLCPAFMISNARTWYQTRNTGKVSEV